MARMTEALWLRSLDEARAALPMTGTPAQQALATLERKLSELTAAQAEARAKKSERESEPLSSLRERIGLCEQVQQLTALLAAEQELRATDQRAAGAHRLALSRRRGELLDLARPRLALKVSRKKAAHPTAATRRRATRKDKSSAKAAAGVSRNSRTPSAKRTSRTRLRQPTS